jgi:hypothetical protein
MRKRVFLGFVMALVALGCLMPCYAQNRFGLMGVINKSSFESQGLTSVPVQSLGYGLLWENSMNGYKGWELGFSYYPRKWLPDSTVNYFHLPVAYNYWLGRYLGVGLGAYYSFARSEVLLNSVSRNIGETSLRSNDFGALGSVKINIPFEIPSFHLLLEARYLYGLANVSSLASVKSRFSDIQYLVGIRIGNIGYKADSKKEAR